MDYVCVQGMAAEVKRGHYTATKLTTLLLVPVFVDGVTHFHDNCLPGFTALHRALTSRQNAFKLGQHSDEDFYTWMQTRPVQQGAFHRFMDAQFASLPTWLDVVPFASEMMGAEAPQNEDVVFVDVGGGNGSQLAALKEKFPELKGRMILQDRPDVLSKALQVEGMEKMPYDFETEQPVKGEWSFF